MRQSSEVHCGSVMTAPVGQASRARLWHSLNQQGIFQRHPWHRSLFFSQHFGRIIFGEDKGAKGSQKQESFKIKVIYGVGLFLGIRKRLFRHIASNKWTRITLLLKCELMQEGYLIFLQYISIYLCLAPNKYVV